MYEKVALLLNVWLAQATLDTSALAKQYFGNDAPWYQDRIPYFEISDSEMQEVYYYRWTIFRAHQRDLGERGYVSTGKQRSVYKASLKPNIAAIQNSSTMSAGN